MFNRLLSLLVFMVLMKKDELKSKLLILLY